MSVRSRNGKPSLSVTPGPKVSGSVGVAILPASSQLESGAAPKAVSEVKGRQQRLLHAALLGVEAATELLSGADGAGCCPLPSALGSRKDNHDGRYQCDRARPERSSRCCRS